MDVVSAEDARWTDGPTGVGTEGSVLMILRRDAFEDVPVRGGMGFCGSSLRSERSDMMMEGQTSIASMKSREESKSASLS